MLKSTLTAAVLTALLLNAGPGSAEPTRAFHKDLEPALNGQVSASGLFPTQAMEDAFHAYLRWTKENGLSRLAAFESQYRDTDVLPSTVMAEQFRTYLAWTETTEARRFHAFQVTNFD